MQHSIKVRRTASLLMALVLMVGCLCLPASATETENNGTASSYGNALVAVARSELDSYVNGTGGSRYWSAYADYTGTWYSSDTPWCVAFVYYCAYECGYLSPEGDGCFGSKWRISCRDTWDWFYEKGIIHTGTDYVPVAGDLVMYGIDSSNPAYPASTDHIGIVEYVSPDGRLTTIEGNAYNVLKRCSYPNYRVGSHAFDSSAIIGYIHPSYPEMIPDGPLYSYIPGLMRSSPHARIICSGTYSTVMAGDVRMVGNDLYKFIREIPNLDKDLGNSDSIQELISLLDYEGEGKLLKIVDAWNAAYEEHGEKLSDLQTRYAVDTHISPVHQTAFSRTGFDWMKTDLRREILWEVSTISGNADASGLILASFASELDNNATDAQVIEAYNKWLPFVVTAFRRDLWSGYDHDTVQFLVENLNQFGTALEYLNKELSLTEEEWEDLKQQER